MTPKSFHTLFARIGERAKMPFPIHPHMLACLRLCPGECRARYQGATAIWGTRTSSTR